MVRETCCGLELGRRVVHFDLHEVVWPLLSELPFEQFCSGTGCARYLQNGTLVASRDASPEHPGSSASDSGTSSSS